MSKAEVKISEEQGIFYLRRDEISFPVTNEEWEYIISKAARAVLEAIDNVTGISKAKAGDSANLEALRGSVDS